MAANEVGEIEVGHFVRRVRGLVDRHPDFRIVWFLGAGCSVTSGIPTAAGLVRRWMPELMKERTGGSDDWESWADAHYPAFAKDPGSVYGEAIGALFQSEREQQRAIEVLTAEKDPQIGYAILAMLMAHDQFGPSANVVLTTNFDDLVQDALYILTRKKPLVVSHDSLVAFARPSRERPLIVKVHGDARLAPRNTAAETAALGPGMHDALIDVLRESCLVFCGYGGNDKSIAELLRCLPAKTVEWGVYWVGEGFPTGPVGVALKERDETVLHVAHGDFDQLILEIAQEFDLNLPPFDRFKKLEDLYAQSLKRQAAARVPSTAQPSDAPSTGGAAAATRMSGTLDAHRLVQEALALHDDPDRAEDLFRRAVAAAGSSVFVLGNYANFLTDVRNDADRAEEFYRRVLTVDPDNAVGLGNYATLLQDVRKDADQAEEYYRRALEADPAHANNLGNYAYFLKNVRNDADRAEEYYRRAVEADPAHANNLGNYAVFLKNVRKDADRAEEYYRRALDADPTNAMNLGNYANFLKDVRNDADQAEEYYRRAIEADPTHANHLSNYAQLLFVLGRDVEAGALIERALAAAPQPSTAVELAFYRFAHLSDHQDALSDLHGLIAGGSRSPGWDLRANVERAIETGHPEPDLLADLAGVIADGAAAETLDRHPAWKRAAPPRS